MTARTPEASTVPEPFSTSTTSNWVAKRGGLPPYIQHVAHHLIDDGHTESEAIGMAVGIIKNWAHGHDGHGHKVSADVQAAAATNLAKWEAMKGTNLSNTIDLAGFNPAEPRAGGQWVAGQGAQGQAANNLNLTPAQLAALAKGLGISVDQLTAEVNGGKAANDRIKAKKAAAAFKKANAPAVAAAKKAATAAASAQKKAATAAQTAQNKAARAATSAQNKANTAAKSAANKAASAAKSSASSQAAADAASALTATKSSTARASAINSLSSADRAVASAKVPPAGFKWSTGSDGTPVLVPSGTNLSNGAAMFRRFRRKPASTPVPRVIELANGPMAERMLPDEAAVRKACAGLPKMTDPKMRAASKAMILKRAKALGIDETTLNLSVPMRITVGNINASDTAKVRRTVSLAVPMNLRAGARDDAKKAGDTLPGTTSYPTQTRALFDKAVLAVGRGGADHDTIRAYLIRRAKAEGWPIPDGWNADGSLK